MSLSVASTGSASSIVSGTGGAGQPYYITTTSPTYSSPDYWSIAQWDFKIRHVKNGWIVLHKNEEYIFTEFEHIFRLLKPE